MFDFDDIITVLEKILEEANKEAELAKKKESLKSQENKPVEKKEIEKKSINKSIYNKLTDKVFCLGDDAFMFTNNDGEGSQFLSFGTKGATITDNQLLVALLYRYRNDVRKYNYVKELLV